MKPASTTQQSQPSRGSLHFVAVAALTVVIAYFGFSFTYFRPMVEGASFSTLLHVHAVSWLGWFLLLLAQAILIRRRRVDLHRSFGVAVSAYTFGLIAVSVVLALTKIARDAPSIQGGLEAVPTIVPLTQIVMFTTLFALAIVWRRRPERHKRLLVLAALVGATPGLARISIGLLGAPNVPLLFLASNALVVLVAFFDWRRYGKLSMVYLWGGLAVILMRTVRIPLAMSSAWETFADQVARLLQ